MASKSFIRPQRSAMQQNDFALTNSASLENQQSASTHSDDNLYSVSRKKHDSSSSNDQSQEHHQTKPSHQGSGNSEEEHHNDNDTPDTPPPVVNVPVYSETLKLLAEGNLDNRTDISLTDDLLLAFNENFQLGSGNIELHNAADNALIESFHNGVGSEGGNLSISKSNLFINPFADLVPDSHYYLTITDGAIKDLSGKALADVTSADSIDFTTVPTDTVAPTLLPSDSQFLNNIKTFLTIAFDENIKLGHGVIEVRNAADNSLVERFTDGTNSTGGSISTTGLSLSIQLSQKLEASHQYYVLVDNQAITDSSGNAFAGITDPSQFVITTAADLYFPTANDHTAPVIISPITLQAPNSLGSDLSFNFSEPVLASTGEIALHKSSDGSVVETFKQGIGSAGGKVSASKGFYTINPGDDLSPDTQYYLTIAPDAIKDNAGNAFAGITDANTLSFTSPGADHQGPVFTSNSVWSGTDAGSKFTNISLSFDEPVYLTAGEIAIHKASDGSIVETFKNGVTNSDSYINASNSILTGQLNLVSYANLEAGNDYYLSIASDALTDKLGNSFAGITDSNTIRFNTPPSLPNPSDQPLNFDSVASQDNLVGMPINADLNLVFNHEIQLGNGAIELHNADNGSLVESFSNGTGSAGGTLTVSKSSATLNPGEPLNPATQYYITVADGAIKDTQGTVFKGFTDPDTFNFFTAGPDTQAPILTSTFPDPSLPIAQDVPISLYFNEDVKFGQGAIELHKSSDQSLVESFNQGAGSAGGIASIGYSSITVDPAANLEPNTQYYLTVANNAITDLSGNSFAGLSTPNQLEFSTVAPDTQAPTLMPAQPGMKLPLDGDLSLIFDENIKLGSGSIEVHKTSDNSLVESFTNGVGSLGGSATTTLSDSKSGSPNSVVVNPFADLAPDTQYYLTLSDNAITDLSGNSAASISDPNAYTFKTFPPGPLFSFLSLEKNTISSDLLVNFDRNIALSSGKIVLHNTSDASAVETFTNGTGSAGGSAVIEGNVLRLNPHDNLNPLGEYYVTLENGSVTDTQGVDFVAGENTDGLSFIAPAIDTRAPELTGYSTPMDNQTRVGINTNITLNFNEAVQFNSGKIELHNASDGSLIETFTHSANLPALSGSKQPGVYGDSFVTLDPVQDLALDTAYYLTVSNDAIVDNSGNAFSGFSDPSIFNFKTTADAANPYGDQGGITPPIIDTVGVTDSPTPAMVF